MGLQTKQPALMAAARPFPGDGKAAAGTIALLSVGSSGYGGATIRDARLARALRRRGYRVVVYWMLGDAARTLGPGVESRFLCSSARYLTARPLNTTDFVLRHLDRRSPARRHRTEQAQSGLLARVLANLADVLAVPGTRDAGLVRRLERWMIRDRVTHLLVGMGILGGLAEAVAARGRHRFLWHATLQGDDLFLDYCRDAAARRAVTRRVNEIVQRAALPPVAVSAHYGREMERRFGLPGGRVGLLYPGIELTPRLAPAQAAAILARRFPGYDPGRPLVSFLGRVDSEKGVDLFLFALRLLRERGVAPQAVVAGSSTFGQDYERACWRMARQMELPAHFAGGFDEAERDALFACSRCVVYPVIHVEAFGMVAAEALAQGTPMVVPRRGGLVEAVSDGERTAGLLFAPWDSADLARQIERLLADDGLHGRLAAAARPLAERFDSDLIAGQLLAQLGLPGQFGTGGATPNSA
jgi:glycosyltransferase involved in cell wall biosynthesis